MARRLIFPLLLGLLGCGILLSLSVWQLQRLGWKQDILADLAQRLAADPVPLPPEGQGERFTPVAFEGVLDGAPVRVLVSRKQIGPGYRIILPVETDGRRVLVDLGFLREGEPLPELRGPVRVVGNLDTPAEIDSYTPANDLAKNLWFSRDVSALAAHFGTEPTFVAARAQVVPGIEAMPLTPEGIPNSHLQYAVTWALLAAVWAGMTALLIWRICQRKS